MTRRVRTVTRETQRQTKEERRLGHRVKMQRQREEIHINRSGKLKITFVVESKSSNGVVVVVVGWFFLAGVV